MASSISSLSGASAGSEEFDAELRTEPFALKELVLPGVQVDDDAAMWIARWLEWQHHLSQEPTDTAAERERKAAMLPPSAQLAPVVPTEATAKRPGLQKLYLAKCRQLTDVGVAALALMLPHATHVQLDSCPRLTSFAVTALARRCSELKWLSIKGCELVDGRSMLAISRMCPFMERVQVARCPGIKQAAMLEAAASLHRVWMGLESSLEVLHAPARAERIGSIASVSTSGSSQAESHRSASRRFNGLVSGGKDRVDDDARSAGSADSMEAVADRATVAAPDGDAGPGGQPMAVSAGLRGDSIASGIGPRGDELPGGSGVIQRYEAWVERQTVRKGKAVSGVQLLKGAKDMDRSERKRKEGLHWTGQGIVRSSSAASLGIVREGSTRRGSSRPAKPLPQIGVRRSSVLSAVSKKSGRSLGRKASMAGSMVSASSVELAGFGAGSPELLIVTPDKGMRGCPPIAIACF